MSDLFEHVREQSREVDMRALGDVLEISCTESQARFYCEAGVLVTTPEQFFQFRKVFARSAL